MHFTTSIVLSILALPLTNAHYTFSGLVVNGEMVGQDWQYIRQHTRTYMPTKGSDILTNDFRCNLGASSGSNTDVYTVKAGDKVAMKQAFGGTGMLHPGPTQVYMSKAPSDVKSYDGSGDWVKVFEGLLCTAGSAAGLQGSSWCMYGEDRIEFTMPSTLSAGEYLARAEHIAIHGAHEGQAEFYYSCAQVKLEGGNTTSALEPTVKIPGVYAVDDAPINFSVWGTATTYPEIPGPEVVSGGQTRGSTDGKSTAIVTVEAELEQAEQAAQVEQEPVQSAVPTSSAVPTQTACPFAGSRAARARAVVV